MSCCVFHLMHPKLLEVFARCKELGALAQVHAENGDVIATVSSSSCTVMYCVPYIRQPKLFKKFRCGFFFTKSINENKTCSIFTTDHALRISLFASAIACKLGCM